MESSEESIMMDSATSTVESGYSSPSKEEDGSSSCDATVGTEEEEEDEEGRRPSQTVDRCSDGSDSGLGPDDEARSTNESSQGEASTAPEAMSPLPELPRSPLPPTATPTRSTLKRRHVAQDEADAPAAKKKRTLTFDRVTVFYFPRAQGFTCVPSQGGSTLGMTTQHSHVQTFTLVEHALEQRKHHRHMLMQLRHQKLQEAEENATNQPMSSSSEDSESDEETSEPSDNELDPDNFYCLQPVPIRQRRIMLKAAGVRKIDSMEKDECRDIRSSREFCGCACKGYCDPDTCSCARAGIKCQVDRLSFPCGCTRDGCANGAGRIEFNLERVRTHFIQTLMRLEMEKKQNAEEERQKQLWGSSSSSGVGELPSASGLLAKQLDSGKAGPHHVSLSPNMESCIHAGNFTTLHYEQQQQSANRGGALDLYSFREEEGFSPQSQQQHNEKLIQHHQQYCNFTFTTPTHNGFTPSQSFTSQQTLEFDTTYNRFQQDHTDYQQQNQLFTNTFNTPTFNYEYHHQQQQSFSSAKSESSGLDFCDPSQVYQQQLGPVLFAPHQDLDKDDSSTSSATSSSKYTSLHTVVNNTKLEPFSELLNAQYTSSNTFNNVAPSLFHPQASFAGCDTIIQDAEQLNPRQNNNNPTIVHEECADNFGEIIKKSMVETVSA